MRVQVKEQYEDQNKTIEEKILERLVEVEMKDSEINQHIDGMKKYMKRLYGLLDKSKPT